MTRRAIHLDPIGGIAGDMFVAAMLDLKPDLEREALAVANRLAAGEADVSVDHRPVGGFAGRRFVVRAAESSTHRRPSDVLEKMGSSDALPPGALRTARTVVELLSKAEATVHGTHVEDVHFHEVGAVDAIVDIGTAAWMIDSTGAVDWSIGSLPLGSGTVATAHGVMPVPAPATTQLLKGFATHDDGLRGERVTPTGAAILATLRPAVRRPSGTLGGSGTGFGSRTLPDRPNALRALAIDRGDAVTGPAFGEDRVAVMCFDVDDQTGEDLAIALCSLRALPGVLDALQTPAFGKKGRMVASVRLLVEPGAVDATREAVFRQTTTLGLRERIERRTVLARALRERNGLRIKTANRPGGVTVKVEADDIAARAATQAERDALRRLAQPKATGDTGKRDA